MVDSIKSKDLIMLVEDHWSNWDKTHVSYLFPRYIHFSDELRKNWEELDPCTPDRLQRSDYLETQHNTGWAPVTDHSAAVHHFCPQAACTKLNKNNLHPTGSMNYNALSPPTFVSHWRSISQLQCHKINSANISQTQSWVRLTKY